MSIEGKIALVTGATRGIGKSVAMNLAAQGAVLIGTATSETGAESITKYLKDSGFKGKGLVLDVASADSIAEVFKLIGTDYAAPEIVVNNAGITRDNIMLRMKEHEWNEVIETDLTSIYRVSKASLRAMTKARWGRIINISSVVASMGNAGQCNYAAAKAGIEGFTRALAREIASRGITVNAIAPGFINTDMTNSLPEAQKDALLGQIPLNRLGSPEEIGAVAAFLAGDGAAYITGETIHVNGGMYM